MVVQKEFQSNEYMYQKLNDAYNQLRADMQEANANYSIMKGERDNLITKYDKTKHEYILLDANFRMLQEDIKEADDRYHELRDSRDHWRLTADQWRVTATNLVKELKDQTIPKEELALIRAQNANIRGKRLLDHLNLGDTQ